MKPPRWTNTYPHGTKEGDEELKFFIALARNPKYQWRSTSAIAKETGLDRARVEEIINKYYKKGMVFQNPKNEDQWGYWERVPEMLPKIQKSITQKDRDDRIGKLNKDVCEDDGDNCCGGSCDDESAACDKVNYVDYVAKVNDEFFCMIAKSSDEVAEKCKPLTQDENFWIPIRPKEKATELKGSLFSDFSIKFQELISQCKIQLHKTKLIQDKIDSGQKGSTIMTEEDYYRIVEREWAGDM